MKWNPKSDTFRFVIRIKFSVKARNIRTGADISKDQVKELNPLSFTKREIYSQVNSIYDPIGLVAPVTMKAKILIRKHWTNSATKLGWDDSLSKNECEEWKGFFEDMFDVESLFFSRCIKPD